MWWVWWVWWVRWVRICLLHSLILPPQVLLQLGLGDSSAAHFVSSTHADHEREKHIMGAAADAEEEQEEADELDDVVRKVDGMELQPAKAAPPKAPSSLYCMRDPQDLVDWATHILEDLQSLLWPVMVTHPVRPAPLACPSVQCVCHTRTPPHVLAIRHTC